MADGSSRDAGGRGWAVPVVGVLAVTVAVSAVGGAFLFLTSMTTCACQPPTPAVDAEATVTTAGSNATVTYDWGTNVDYLQVEWRAPKGSVTAVGGQNVSVRNGSARLRTPGAELTLAATNRSTDTTMMIVVRARGQGMDPVVREATVTL